MAQKVASRPRCSHSANLLHAEAMRADASTRPPPAGWTAWLTLFACRSSALLAHGEARLRGTPVVLNSGIKIQSAPPTPLECARSLSSQHAGGPGGGDQCAADSILDMRPKSALCGCNTELPIYTPKMQFRFFLEKFQKVEQKKNSVSHVFCLQNQNCLPFLINLQHKFFHKQVLLFFTQLPSQLPHLPSS
jgi:hypothetical protein